MWLRRVVVFALAAPIAVGCTARPAPEGPAAVDGEVGVWQGELASYVVSRAGGEGSRIEHRLRAADGTVRPLRFTDPMGLAPGIRLTVWGRTEGQGIAVDRYQLDGDADEPVVAWTAPPKPPETT